MPLQKATDRQYLEKQYQDSSKLNARFALHRRFSVNPYDWQSWVFDHFELPPRGRILELGCGPGNLWLTNLRRIPADWEILLSDFSAGMLEETKKNLADLRPFRFEVIDAQSIPLEDGSFDAVIANHMLHHIEDKSATLAEIQRVLKPAGRFYASTTGERHLSEIADLVEKYTSRTGAWRNVAGSFNLERGADLLSPWFRDIQIDRYPGGLEVTDAAPLVDYILSGRTEILPEQREHFLKFVAGELQACGGVFHVTIDSGLFSAIRKGE
jgi:SAM-dependent methyltransferase